MDPRHLAFRSSPTNINPRTTLRTPLVFIWLFVFRIQREHLVISAYDTGAMQVSGSFMRVSTHPIERWTIDSNKVIEIAQSLSATEKGSGFHLKVARFWTELFPVWLVPICTDP